jgi:hypothetical protein
MLLKCIMKVLTPGEVKGNERRWLEKCWHTYIGTTSCFILASLGSLHLPFPSSRQYTGNLPCVHVKMLACLFRHTDLSAGDVKGHIQPETLDHGLICALRSTRVDDRARRRSGDADRRPSFSRFDKCRNNAITVERIVYNTKACQPRRSLIDRRVNIWLKDQEMSSDGV